MMVTQKSLLLGWRDLIDSMESSAVDPRESTGSSTQVIMTTGYCPEPCGAASLAEMAHTKNLDVLLTDSDWWFLPSVQAALAHVLPQSKWLPMVCPLLPATVQPMPQPATPAEILPHGAY
jgi:hypothetical protein